MKPRGLFRIAGLLAFCSLNVFSAPGETVRRSPRDDFFASHTIPHIRIQIETNAIAALRNKMREYVKATVFEGTNTFPDVGIHLKGQYGTFQTIDGRPSLTLNFDKYVKGQRFHGLDKLHLNNSAQDPSYLCEWLGRQLFQEAGVPVPRSGHARLTLNDRDLGLFVLVEGYDRQFLKRHFGNPDGNLYDSEFRHEIADPIRKSSGRGPDNHSDLLNLAVAVEEPNPELRLAKLSGLLDLDRFYTMLALETLMRHHDGYSMGINNYRVYFDPVTGRAVLLPGGMDQLFFQPSAGLLPDLRGVLSKAVLETSVGRRQFRARCATLFTNLFAGLSNRVEAARLRMQPALAGLDARTLRHAQEAVTNLHHRIQQRLEHLAAEFSAPAYPPAFNDTGTARLTNWVATMEGGRATMAVTNVAGEPMLWTRLGGGGDQALARWQSWVWLAAGTYRFSARVMADQPVFRGPTSPVALRVWGLTEVQLESRRPTREQMDLEVVFRVTPESQGEHVLQCEAKGKEMPVAYRFEAVALTRLE